MPEKLKYTSIIALEKDKNNSSIIVSTGCPKKFMVDAKIIADYTYKMIYLKTK